MAFKLKESLLVIFLISMFILGLHNDYTLASEELAKEQVLILATLGNDIGSIDPIGSDMGGDFPIRKQIYGGLVRYALGDVSNFEPDLATRWEVSSDNLTWTFHLRKGVKWHWGLGEVTSEDVVYSLNRSKNSKISIWRGHYVNFKEIKAVDRYTVQISTFKPDAFLLHKVANDFGGFILCKKAIEKAGAYDRRLSPTKEEAIGTGRFKFEEYKPKNEVILVRNDDYWEGKPILEKVIFKWIPDDGAKEMALLKGDIYGMKGLDDGKWLNHIESKGLKLDHGGVSDVKYFHFNLRIKPFDDKRVREAFAYGVSQESIMRMQGKAISRYATTPVSNDLEYSIDAGWAKYKRDPEKAKKLLAEAGYPNGLTVKLFMTTGAWYLDKMIIWQDELKECGINLEMTQVDHTVYKVKIRQGVNPVLMWGLRYPTATYTLRDAYHTDSIIPNANNFSYYSNPEVDRLIELAETSFDKKIQRDALAKAQKLIVEDLPAIGVIETSIPIIRHPWVDLGYKFKTNFIWNYEIGLKTRILKH